MEYYIKRNGNTVNCISNFLEAIEYAVNMYKSGYRSVSVSCGWKGECVTIDEILKDESPEIKPKKRYRIGCQYFKYVEAENEDQALEKGMESLCGLDGLGDGWFWSEDVDFVEEVPEI